MLPGPAVPGCCLLSFHILWAILSTSTVPYVSVREWKGCVYRTSGKRWEHTTLPFPFWDIRYIFLLVVSWWRCEIVAIWKNWIRWGCAKTKISCQWNIGNGNFLVPVQNAFLTFYVYRNEDKIYMEGYFPFPRWNISQTLWPRMITSHIMGWTVIYFNSVK